MLASNASSVLLQNPPTQSLDEALDYAFFFEEFLHKYNLLRMSDTFRFTGRWWINPTVKFDLPVRKHIYSLGFPLNFKSRRVLQRSTYRLNRSLANRLGDKREPLAGKITSSRRCKINSGRSTWSVVGIIRFVKWICATLQHINVLGWTSRLSLYTVIHSVW